MEVIVERPAALDVHNASVMACVRAPGTGRRRVEHVAEFQTTVQGLLTLRDWLEAHEVDQVAMEATGVYWKPVWAVLEDRFKCLLVNARHVKQVPGRKTDVLDAQWLCQLLEAGLLRASLVRPKPVRTLRNLTRYRKSQIRDRQREMNRLHKVMQDTGIKLDCVATDMLGKSGRAMLDALVSGTTDPNVLADLARGQLRKKLPALRTALEGRFDAEHVAQPDAGRVRQERQSHQEHLPRSPIRTIARASRRQQGHDRRLPLDPDRRLAHAQHRRDLRRSRRRLLRPPRPPNAPANASSASSNASATPSPSRRGHRQPKRDFLYSDTPRRRPRALMAGAKSSVCNTARRLFTSMPRR
jgi:hypothetical protein